MKKSDIIIKIKQEHSNRYSRAPEVIALAPGRINIIGEHTVMFAGDNETIKLSHSAMNRKIFVRGAYHAAKWSVKQKPGLYSMDDVLDFD